MQMRIFIIVLLSFVGGACLAQSKRKQKKENEEAGQLPNSMDPSSSQKKESYAPKKERSPKTNFDNPEEDFYNRMKDLQKTKRKNEKMMEKPQYSDPMYFGHKRPPKKHRPDKMKFCKVCGIRH